MSLTLPTAIPTSWSRRRVGFLYRWYGSTRRNWTRYDKAWRECSTPKMYLYRPEARLYNLAKFDAETPLGGKWNLPRDPQQSFGNQQRTDQASNHHPNKSNPIFDGSRLSFPRPTFPSSAAANFPPPRL